MIDGGDWKVRDVCGCRYSWIQVLMCHWDLGYLLLPALLSSGMAPHSGGPFLGGSLLISYAGVLELVKLVSLDKFGFFVHPELFTKGRGMDWPGPDCVSTPRPWDRGHPTQTAQAGEECSPSGEQRLCCQKRRDWKPHRWRRQPSGRKGCRSEGLGPPQPPGSWWPPPVGPRGVFSTEAHPSILQ